MTTFPDCSMRRSDRALSTEEARRILEKGEYGIMSTTGQDGIPYGVPLSYVVEDDMIYFHCAMDGRKIRNITQHPEVCFTVVGAVQAVYDKGFSTWYESAMVFGTVRKIDNEQDKHRILLDLAAKYLPEHVAVHAEADIARSCAITEIYGIHICQMTGKAKRPQNVKV